MILNLHGLNGKCDNSAYRILQNMENSVIKGTIVSPQIEYEKIDPLIAIVQIDRKIRDAKLDYVVGNSLGGFYALLIAKLYDVPCIVTNPCVPPKKYMPNLIKDYSETYLHSLGCLERELTRFNQPVNIILGLDDEVIDPLTTYNWLWTAGIKELNIFTIEGGKHRLSQHDDYRKIFERAVNSVEDSIRS